MTERTIKKNLYFPTELLDEIVAEAERLNRSVTWLLTRSWHLARHEISDFPNYPLLPSEIPGALQSQAAAGMGEECR